MKLIRFLGLTLVVLLASVPSRAKAQGPQGWVGVVITSIGQRDDAGRTLFDNYPVIESIDAGSPAERAGLQAGDVLISINAQDFKRNPIPMKSLLVPGQKIVLTYRRNDVDRTSTLMVVERPADNKSWVIVQDIKPVTTASDKRRTEGLLNRNVAVERATRSPIVHVTPLVIGAGPPTLSMFGMEVTRLNPDLRDVLKVNSDGLFVIQVAVGTPAGQSGLKSGDVIIEANREAVQNPGELLRLMREATSERSLMLRIVRKQKPQSLTLRW